MGKREKRSGSGSSNGSLSSNALLERPLTDVVTCVEFVEESIFKVV
jgi:hypothetical protein